MSNVNWPLVVAFIVGVAILGWFVAGTQWNVSKGHKVLRWLQGGLPLVGERTTLRWFGSSAIQLNIAKARDPFREAELLIVMEPRDISLLWLLARLRGRRDVMILRGRLRRPPRFEMELADPAAWTGREGLDRLDRSAWSETQIALTPPEGARGESSLTLYYQGAAAPARAADLLARLRAVSPSVARISLRRGDTTQFQVHIGLPDVRQADANRLFRTIIDIARSASEE